MSVQVEFSEWCSCWGARRRRCCSTEAGVRALMILIAGMCLLSDATVFGQQSDFERPSTGVISGCLRQPNGDPLPNATVAFVPGGISGSRTIVRTVANGRFGAEVRINTPYTLSLEAPGFQTRVTKVNVSQNERRVDLGDLTLEASDIGSGPATSSLSSELPMVIRDGFDFPGLNRCLQTEGLDLEQSIRTTWFSLGDEPDDALLVQGVALCLAGATNGNILVFLRDGDTWRKVLDVIGSQVHTLSHRTNGLLDLARWQHGSAVMSARYVYQFDGDVYQETLCEDVYFADTALRVYDPPLRTPCE